jgi:hypothetical protein
MSKLVKVKIVDKNLQRSYGTYHHYGLDMALRGQREGKWIIMDEKNGKEATFYEDKSMESGGAKSYLTKKAFKQPSVLSYKDIFGKSKK